MMLWLFDVVQLCSEQILLKYLLLCCVSINVKLFVLPAYEAKKYCHGEFSLVREEPSQSVVWVDFHYTDSPVIFSNPLCLDRDGKTITRVCHKGQWKPASPPLCDRISTNKYCPDEYYENGTSCVINYEQFKPKLALPETKLSSEINKKNKSCETTETFHKSNTSEQSNISKNVHCDSSNYIVLPYDHNFYVCPDNCVPAELGVEKCYCKVWNDSETKRVVVTNYFQKQILAQLAGNDICKVENDIDFDDRYQKVIYKTFYGFAENSTNCSLVESEILQQRRFEPSMVLSFDDVKRKLTLSIEHPEELSRSTRYHLRCYTNAGTDLIRSVRFNKVNRKYSNRFAVYDLNLEKYIGEYWCEAASVNLTKITSNRVLAFREKFGNEYSLNLLIKDEKGDHFREDKMQKDVSEDIREILRVEPRFMMIQIYNSKEAEAILHLTTKKSANISSEYIIIKNKLKELPNYMEVLNFTAVEYCLPDSVYGQEVLHWDLTKLWERKISKELCLQANQEPVMRTCLGDFIHGAFWSDVSGNCSKNVEIPEVTKYLHNILYTNISEDLLRNVSSITKDDSLSYLDIYLYSELIPKIILNEGEQNEATQRIFQLMNNLSKQNRNQLISSQLLLNTTDTLLSLLEYQTSSKYLNVNESYIFSDEKLLIIAVKPFNTNVSGIYLLGEPDTALNKLEVFYLFRNQSIESIDKNHLKEIQLAVYVPEDILQQVKMDSEDSMKIQIVFTIFQEDSFFTNFKHRAANKVVSVSIDGYGTYLNGTIPIVLRSNIGDEKCGFWDFGQKLQRHKGEWSSFGGNYSGNFLENTDLHVCDFSHLTHFALLILSEGLKIDEGSREVNDLTNDTKESDIYLTLLTIIGGIFSVLGILGIYATAFMFQQWRQKDGTIILLNLSTAILLEILLLQFSGAPISESPSNCRLIGCLLHYVVLSKFCWMFIYALLQYKRFVKVLGAKPKSLIYKSVLFGWGFALIPVLSTLIVSPENYSKMYICYVHGWPLYLGVIFPVFFITFTNFIVFLVVMYNVSTKKVESTVDSKFSVLQIYLAILLFSVLGIPWLFVITAEFVGDSFLRSILIYMFSATGTLQGFILFTFYVLFNEETRHAWRRYFSRYSR